MKYIFSFGLLALVPFVSSAATFHYVTASGVTASVEATDAQTALQVAPNIAQNSGVAIDRGLIDSGEAVSSVAGTQAAGGVRAPGDAATYFYVNTQGLTDSVTATDAQTALTLAPNIAVHSGVAIDRGLLEEGMVVESVAN